LLQRQELAWTWWLGGFILGGQLVLAQFELFGGTAAEDFVFEAAGFKFGGEQAKLLLFLLLLLDREPIHHGEHIGFLLQLLFVLLFVDHERETRRAGHFKERDGLLVVGDLQLEQAVELAVHGSKAQEQQKGHHGECKEQVVVVRESIRQKQHDWAGQAVTGEACVLREALRPILEGKDVPDNDASSFKAKLP
jgi:hypothetical protein